MNTEIETMFDGAFVADKEEAKWGLWKVVWRPLRHRWCLVLDHKSMPWTAEELAADPSLRARVRPSRIAFGPIWLVLDAAATLQPPSMDVLEDWTSPLGVRRRNLVLSVGSGR